MIRICTADWQLDNNPRDRYRIDFVVEKLPELLIKYKVDQLLVLGDITEAKDQHPAPLVNIIVDCFHSISKICEIVILEGNHDYLHERHPFFEFVSCFDNVSWISVPTIRDNCLFLPHTRDYKKEWANVDFTREYDFIFAHNIFEGVKANGQLLSGIPHTIFREDALVISGDVHEPQSIADGKIVYVGSPVLCDFGDDYQPRVLLLDDLDVKSIKVYGQQKRLINGHWPMGTAGFANKANENDIVKIQVHIDMEHVAEWADIRKQVEDWAIQNKFVVNSIIPVVDVVQGKRSSLISSASHKSDDDYLTSFVKRAGIDDKTIQVGKKLLKS